MLHRAHRRLDLIHVGAVNSHLSPSGDEWCTLHVRRRIVVRPFDFLGETLGGVEKTSHFCIMSGSAGVL
jgi:hypothetical protein